MTPREALNLLDQVAARFQGSREDHANLQAALAVLNGVVEKTGQEPAGAATVAAEEDLPA